MRVSWIDYTVQGVIRILRFGREKCYKLRNVLMHLRILRDAYETKETIYTQISEYCNIYYHVKYVAKDKYTRGTYVQCLRRQ